MRSCRTLVVVGAAAHAVLDTLESRTLLAYVPIAGINDVVYDSSRNVVYATAGATIQRYDVAGGQLLTPWTVGGNLLGADITPDNAYLYVADGNNPQIRKVNLSDGTSTAITYTPDFGESNAYDVAIVGSRAIFTTQYSGSGWTPLRNIDLATGTISVRSDLGSVRQNSVLSRAADGSALFLTESNISSGPIHYYSTVQDKFTAGGGTQTSLTNTLHDVSRDGKRCAGFSPAL
jgi:DNA-binding beta-propeller fold protein YncE